MPTITETPHDIQSLKQLKQRLLDVAERIDTNIETMELNELEVISVPGYKTMMRSIVSIEKHTDDCRQNKTTTTKEQKAKARHGFRP